MPDRNVICGVKFGRFWTFDHRRPSWILMKMKNSPVGLFLVLSSMSMSDLVQIGWTGSQRRAEMWFAGWNLADFGPLIAGGHLGFCNKWKKLFRRLVPRVKQYVYATFFPNRMSQIRMPGQNVIWGVKFGIIWPFFDLCDLENKVKVKNFFSMKRGYLYYGGFVYVTCY